MHSSHPLISRSDTSQVSSLREKNAHPLSPRAVFWIAFLAFFLLTSAWSLANPLMASPDEQSHLKKAAATAYGQVFDQKILIDRVVDIPEVYADAEVYLCNAFQPEVPISTCDDALIHTTDSPNGWVEVPTPAARYNPVYYALISWPALFSHSVASIYAMRIVSGLIASFFLALGLRALRQSALPPIAIIAATAGITPMTAFLASSINPQSLEISSAFAVWCLLLLIIRATRPEDLGRRMWLLAFTASVFANSRGLTPFFLALIVVCAIALQPWSMTWRVIRDKRSWAPIAVTTLATAAASLWIVGTGVLTTSEPVSDPSLTPLWLAMYTLRMTDTYLQHAVGSFGWLHVPLPLFAVVLFLSAYVASMVLVYMYGTRRDRIVVFVSLVFTCLVVPVALHASQARSLGIMWQGRYILPMFIGIPVLAAFVLAKRMGSAPAARDRRLTTAWALIFSGVHCFAVLVELHRHMLGMSAGWDLRRSEWFPPIPLWLLGIVFLLFTLAICVLMNRMGVRRPPLQDAHATTHTHSGQEALTGE